MKQSQTGPRSGPSQRQLRVGEQMRHSLSQILQREFFRDPDLSDAHNITVTEIRVSPDLKNATAYVIRLGGGDMEATLDALNRASGFLRSNIAQEVRMKYTPRLKFETDTSFDYATHIDDILKDERVARDLKNEDDTDGAEEEE